MVSKHKSKRRRVLITASAGLFSIGLFFLILRQDNPLTHKNTSTLVYSGPVTKISTGIVGEYGSLVWIAQNQGYFKKNGLDVTIKDYPSGPAALTDLFANKLDIAGAADFAGVRNSFNGEDLKILTTMSRSETFDIIANKPHGITEISSLKGKKIGFTSQTAGEFYLGQFLTFNRLNESEVSLVNLPQADLVDALTSGRIDAAVLFEPNAYNAKAKLGNQAVGWSVQSQQDLYSLLFTTGKFTIEQPDAIKRYLQALISAEEFIKSHDKQARTIVAKQLSYDGYIDYIWPKHTFEVSLTQELLINMDDEARWAIKKKLTTATKEPNYLNMIYFNGLDAVKPDAVTMIH